MILYAVDYYRIGDERGTPIAGTLHYANEPCDALKSAMEELPLLPGEEAVVSDFNGDPILTAARAEPGPAVSVTWHRKEKALGEVTYISPTDVTRFVEALM